MRDGPGRTSEPQQRPERDLQLNATSLEVDGRTQSSTVAQGKFRLSRFECLSDWTGDGSASQPGGPASVRPTDRPTVRASVLSFGRHASEQASKLGSPRPSRPGAIVVGDPLLDYTDKYQSFFGCCQPMSLLGRLLASIIRYVRVCVCRLASLELRRTFAFRPVCIRIPSLRRGGSSIAGHPFTLRSAKLRIGRSKVGLLSEVGDFGSIKLCSGESSGNHLHFASLTFLYNTTFTGTRFFLRTLPFFPIFPLGQRARNIHSSVNIVSDLSRRERNLSIQKSLPDK